jgi:hypothetical protein
MELLPMDVKQELGELALVMIDKPKLASLRELMVWMLGRLGQRHPLYGPLNTVLPNEIVETWIDSLLSIEEVRMQIGTRLAVVQMSRRTNDRYRDIHSEKRARVIQWLTAAGAGEHLVEMVSIGGRFDFEEQQQIVGDSLPPGLRLDESRS